MIVYKGQGIDWHPQSDSLGVSSLKWTCSTPPLISGLHRLVKSLMQIDFALLVVSLTRAGRADLSRAEWNSWEGEGRAMEQGDCVCCKKRGIECVPLTEGKATACVACQLARVKCM